jgi:hypothetical protein
LTLWGSVVSIDPGFFESGEEVELEVDPPPSLAEFDGEVLLALVFSGFGG